LQLNKNRKRWNVIASCQQAKEALGRRPQSHRILQTKEVGVNFFLKKKYYYPPLQTSDFGLFSKIGLFRLLDFKLRRERGTERWQRTKRPAELLDKRRTGSQQPPFSKIKKNKKKEKKKNKKKF